VEDRGDVVLVRLTAGTLAAQEEDARALARLLDLGAIQARGRDLALDFGNVDLPAGTALGLLVRLHRKVRAGGGSLALYRLPDNLHEACAARGLTSPFEARRAAPAPRRDRRPRVLVADDQEFIRLLLDRALRRAGFSVLLAADGQEAVERFRQDAQGVDVLLLDVQMPGLSGPEALAALGRFSRAAPCCFMTGDPGRYREEDLLGTGAARVFHKPFVLAEVVATLRRLAGAPTP
jgi:CheY-like chemotaxis protein